MRVRIFRKGGGRYDVLIQHARRTRLPASWSTGLLVGNVAEVVGAEALLDKNVRDQLRAVKPAVTPG